MPIQGQRDNAASQPLVCLMLDFCPALDRDHAAHLCTTEPQDSVPTEAEPRWIDPAVRELLAGENVRSHVEYRRLVGSRIYRARQAARLQGRELAARLGHRNGTQISLWESGERAPTVEALVIIAAHCGTSVEYLAGCAPDEDPDRMSATQREAIRHARAAIEAAVAVVASACTGLPRAAADVESAWQRLGGLLAELLAAVATCRDRNERLFNEELIGGARLLATADRLALAVADMGIRSGLQERLRTDIAAAHCRVMRQYHPEAATG